MLSQGKFVKFLSENYLQKLGIAENARYPSSGHPVLAVPPHDCAVGKLLILGAYPTAVYLGNRTPIQNIAMPFDPSTKSGRELDEKVLRPLGITRNDCWITNFVKCYLFKTGGPPALARAQFEKIGMHPGNQEVLANEFTIANPKAILTLGTEVAGMLRGVEGGSKRNALLNKEKREVTIGNWTGDCYHFAHPGILMRSGQGNNPWPQLHATFVRSVSVEIRSFVL